MRSGPAPEKRAGARSGVVIGGLRADSICKPAGLCVGHLLLSINETLVTTHQHAVRLIDSATRIVDVVYRDNLTVLTLTPTTHHETHHEHLLELHDAPHGMGVVVDRVSAAEALAAAGLAEGDVIVSIDDELLRSAERAHVLLKRAGTREVRVLKRA